MQSSIARAALAAALLAVPAYAGPQHADHACPADCADACCVNLEELVGFKQPDLWVGTEAPALAVADFVKGDSIHGFADGQVYVVEFWATWCGPCIKAMPHVTELQKHYGDDVRFVGVNIWDTKPGETQATRIQRVSKWVNEHSERMGYTVAVSQAEGEDEPVSESWMKAGGRMGIPSAFIVDAKGNVAWMGGPTELDEPLGKIVSGQYSYQDMAKGVRDEAITMSAYMAFAQGIHSQEQAEADKALTLARALAKQKCADDADMLNALAWTAVEGDQPRDKDIKFAREAAETAANLSAWKEPMILDTLAVATFKSGDRARAIEIESKAIELLDPADTSRQSYLDQLKTFKDAG